MSLMEHVGARQVYTFFSLLSILSPLYDRNSDAGFPQRPLEHAPVVRVLRLLALRRPLNQLPPPDALAHEPLLSSSDGPFSANCAERLFRAVSSK